MGILAFALLIGAIILVLGGFYFSIVVTQPKTFSVDETYQFEVEKGKIIKEELENYEKEEIVIHSQFDYPLYGEYYPQQNAKRTIIIIHGITYTAYGSVKYMQIFRKQGFNILLVDLRNHGRSGGKNTSFGYYEKYDIKTWADWLFEKHKSIELLGVHGESMGAAIALQYAAIDLRCGFVIADCPFCDAKELFSYRLRQEYHLPGLFLIPAANAISWLRTGFSFGSASPIRDLQDIQQPILFIHGENDRYIPKEMSLALYNKKSGAKMLFLAPNAGHAESYWNNRELYEQKIDQFLGDNSLLI